MSALSRFVEPRDTFGVISKGGLLLLLSLAGATRGPGLMRFWGGDWDRRGGVSAVDRPLPDPPPQSTLSHRFADRCPRTSTVYHVCRPPIQAHLPVIMPPQLIVSYAHLFRLTHCRPGLMTS